MTSTETGVGIEAKSPAIYELVEEGSAVERVATGFTFTEGPIWHPDGYLLFSDMPGDVRRKYTAGQGAEEVMRPAFKCNGMTLDANLDLIVCEHVTSALWRERRDGSREVLAYHYEGKYLNSPNDVCVRSDGSIYFSDPWYGRMPGFGIERERELGWQGVFRIPPGGGPEDVELVVDKDEFEMPNGLCFSPDESLLYINDTPRAHIKVFDVDAGRVDLERPHVLRGRRLRRDRGRHPGRDEVRRAGQHLGHRAWRDLDHLRRRRAPGRDQGAGEHGQPDLGRRGLAHGLHPELDLALHDPRQGRPAPRAVHALGGRR